MIGSLVEMDLISIVPFGKVLTPWSWSDVLADEGGMLNNGFPHFLGIIERMVEGKVTWVTGEARVLRRSAPFVPDLHDWRQVIFAEVSEEEAAKLEWKECDAENAFSAILKVATPLARSDESLAVGVRMNMFAPVASPVNGWYLIGDEGVLICEGPFSLKITKRVGDSEEELPVPDSLIRQLPEGESHVQQKWSALVRDFVADIRGEENEPYLTFRDGWRYQAIADAVRNGSPREIPGDA